MLDLMQTGGLPLQACFVLCQFCAVHIAWQLQLPWLLTWPCSRRDPHALTCIVVVKGLEWQLHGIIIR